MALGAVLAAALTDHSARAFGLTIQGLDVLKQPGGGYGVPLESVKLTQRGPGGVSDLTFTIEDASLAIGIGKGDFVRLADYTNNYCLFAGFVIGWEPEPWQPGGRRITVRCSGVEIILDWAKVQAFTVVAGTIVQAAVQQAVGNVISGTAQPLRALAQDVGTADGTQALPIGYMGGITTDASADLAVPVGTTLREAIRMIGASSQFTVLGSATDFQGPVICTVGYDLGLRVFIDSYGAASGLGLPTDWGQMDARTDQATGTVAAADLHYQIDATGPSAVLVIGSSGNSVVSDGTGRPGPTATLTDTTLTTAAMRISAGIAYLAQYAQPARGSFTLEDRAVSTTIVAGSFVNLTAPEFGLSPSTQFRITEIGRTFYGTRQDWHVTFGGLSPSFASLARRLTRSTLS